MSVDSDIGERRVPEHKLSPGDTCAHAPGSLGQDLGRLHSEWQAEVQDLTGKLPAGQRCRVAMAGGHLAPRRVPSATYRDGPLPSFSQGRLKLNVAH